MKKTFRVLLLDDTEDTLNYIRHTVKGRLIHGVDWQVEVSAIHIRFEQLGNVVLISKETLRDLAHACSGKFDLLFSDYGYVTDHAAVKQLAKKTSVEKLRDEMKPFVFHPTHILEHAKLWLNESSDTDFESAIKQIQRSFQNHSNRAFIYTYSPPPFDTILPRSEQWTNKMKDLFPRCKEGSGCILVFQDLFYGVANIEELQKTMTHVIVGKFVAQRIEIELLESSLNELKAVQKEAIKKALGSITVFAISLAICMELSTKAIIKLIDLVHLGWVYIFALITSILMIFVLISIVNWFAHHRLEKIGQDLIKDNDLDRSKDMPTH